MKTERAQEIAASPIMVHVICRDRNIYIESVDATSATAVISPVNQRSKHYVVPLSELVES